MMSDGEQHIGDTASREPESGQFVINPLKSGNELLLSEIFPSVDGKVPLRHVLSTRSTPHHKKEKYGDKSSDIAAEDKITRPKRKRRVFSCDSCRKLKTKCVIDPKSTCCQRCGRLDLECSLSRRSSFLGHETHNYTSPNRNDSDEKQAERDITDYERRKHEREGTSTGYVLSESINERIINVEDHVNSMNEKIDGLIKSQQKSNELYVDVLNILNQNPQKQGNPTDPPYKLHSNDSGDIPQRQYSHEGSFISNTEVSTPSIASYISLSNKLPAREDISAPLSLIDKIQSTLIKETGNDREKSDFDQSIDGFIQFYLSNETLCLKLAKEFLQVSHYYIIPGGISVIDRDYVLQHPFIACVFISVATMLSKELGNSTIGASISQLLKNIISSMNSKEPLTDHDIESILYICMYDIGNFDKWILSTSGLMNYFTSIDIRGIIKRVMHENIHLDDDLFHLRIFNSLCACHLQTAVGFGRTIMIKEDWWKIHQLTIMFPNATIGDAIQVAQLDLFKVLIHLLEDSGSYIEPEVLWRKARLDTGDEVLHCDDLKKWSNKWSRIISKDNSNISLYSYYFSYVLIARKYAESEEQGSVDEGQLELLLKTASHYSFELLRLFLGSKELVKGMPSFQLTEVVYACVTLFEYLVHMDGAERAKTLNIISKTYWHLNKMGQSTNDATGTIARLVKRLVEMASKNEVLSISPTQDRGFIGTGSVTNSSMYIRQSNSQQQKKLSPQDLPVSMDGDMRHLRDRKQDTSSSQPVAGKQQSRVLSNNSIGVSRDSTPTKHDSSTKSVSNWRPDELFQIPDLSNFANFDDFFNDLFH